MSKGGTEMIFQFLKTPRSLLGAVWDMLVLFTPVWHIYRLHPGWGKRFAFFVHPRDITDIYRPYPIFKKLPNKFVHWYGRNIMAITLSKIRGTASIQKGVATSGYLLSIVMTPKEMLRHREKAEYRIDLMYRLAHRKGASIIGLGAWLPAMSEYGRKLENSWGLSNWERPGITTGHAYTAWAIVEYLKELVTVRNNGRSRVRVGIVGAAGSTGALTTMIIARLGNINSTKIELTLIEQATQEKLDMLEDLRAQLPDVADLVISGNLDSLSYCDYAITVTNSPRAIIRPRHLKKGAVVIDDSQPRNTSPDLPKSGVYVVDVLASVPRFDANFDFGFKTNDAQVTFTCMAEVALLAAVNHSSDFSIGSVSLETVDMLKGYFIKLNSMGINFRTAAWHSFGQPMDVLEVKNLLRSPDDELMGAK
jgi:fatty aldehyde-generating acyl-ACP reductase